MKKSMFLIGSLAIALLTSQSTWATTLQDVKARGKLNCGVSTGNTGLSAPDANGVWKGLDVAVCRAVAAAVLGDPKAVNFVPTTGQTRFTALASGEVDVLARNSSWTFTRDVDLKLTFAGINYYDGQGFLVKKSLGVKSVKDLSGASVCVQTGSTHEVNLAEYFRNNGMTYESVPIDSTAEGEQKYLAGACDVFTNDVSGLAASRASFATPSDHDILPELISKEPLGPMVRQGDDQWADIVRWTLNALIEAEELGVTSANLNQMAAGTKNPDINRLLGNDGNLGTQLGLSKDWAKQAIAAGGNYGEIFDSTLGKNTPIGLERGLSALWNKGGLLYTPPFQ
ncbi:amino acid ABC transporter substrate-binding protein [Pseudomonas aeruginosa]|nr:amino acid ABC transporter substrate-binding protein [Pseudomonas aeruginosa]MCS8829167.1 amino acid ABC transporter substrate-binding protein [Pseudomonas aeruginosa]MCS8874012.1 amino acid ABC transporter substrate-binding protein [Pseudomonas aeruginosa]MCS8907990.1 amino acid ABC transporter substrate-binding protein [Pseudomonas aeruginosa]MCS8914041.1 amino acid ABC transporter substrate-binding protein [Pseudomonas aeruginosa]